jgi:hypothetical protein
VFLEVVVAATRPDTLPRLIESLELSARPPDWVTVVSNEVLEVRSSLKGGILGFNSDVYPFGRMDVALRRNIGIWHSTADAVVFLDDDEVAPRDMLGEFERLLGTKPVVWGHHRFIDLDSGDWHRVLDMKPGSGASREYGVNREHSFQSGYAGCLGLSREAAVASGGFDLMFLGRHANEDQNFAKRISGPRITVNEPPFAWHPTTKTYWSMDGPTNICTSNPHRLAKEQIGGVFFQRCDICPYWHFDDGHEALFRDNVVIPFDKRLVSLTESRFIPKIGEHHGRRPDPRPRLR